jgi:hypothetical protein
MNKSFSKLVSSILVLGVFCTFTLADVPSAVLYANGNVNVNGKKVVRSTSVFDGDSIQTAADGGSVVTLNGSSVSLPGGSRVVFAKNGIQVLAGGVSIKTSQRMTASVGGYQILPEELDSQFQVLQTGKKVQIAAVRGKLAVQSGATMLSLAAGKSMTLDCKTCSTVAEPQAGEGSGGNNEVWLGLGIGFAAAAIGTVLGLVLSDPQEDASPAGP